MVDPVVLSVIVTVCGEVNEPLAGVITGVAAGACPVPLAEKLQFRIF
jgi:hypothetical protein